MFNFIRRHLGAKIFLSYLAVISIGALVLGITTLASLPRAFNRHMGVMMQASAEGGRFTPPGSGPAQGRGAGQGGMMMRNLYDNFRASFTEALTLAAAAAFLAALAVSVTLSRRIVAPVQVLQSAAGRIAAGHYEDRVQPKGEDELAQLAHSFNRMAGELEQVETMRRRLIGDIAHELRTPIAAIQGSAEGLMDGILPANAETFQQIYHEALRLSRLVNDLQELSWVEAGAYELNLQPVDLGNVFATVSKRMKSAADDKRINLTLSLPVNLPHVLADEDRLLQIMTNLLGNALQYTPPGGSVTVSVGVPAGGQVQVSVRDTGIGIPAEHLPYVFDRFYRVDQSRSRQHGGSGIGLTIARHLVEAHGGRIWVESPGEGQGSVFHFTLPTART